MGILSKLLGAGDVIKEGFQLIDDMHTSEEEEIAARAKAKTDLLSAYAPFKIAQRYLALMFGFTFLLSFFMVLAMTLGGIGKTDDVMRVLSEFYIGEIMLTIIFFYFGGGFAEGAIAKFRTPK